MKTFSIIMKILAALAVIAGIVYAVVVYGDRITAWFRKMANCCMSKCSCLCNCGEEDSCICNGECTCEGECDCECECTCEGGCDCADEESGAVAEETDFEG